MQQRVGRVGPTPKKLRAREKSEKQGKPETAGEAGERMEPGQSGRSGRPRARAYAGRLVDAVPSARRNGAAVAGAALSVVPLVGMALSILGLTRAHALGGAGRTVATVGLVFSLALTLGEGFAVYELGKPSAPADPACVTTRAEVDALQQRLADDASALSAAQAAGDPTTADAAASTLVTDLRAVKSSLDRGVGEAKHADVRVGIQAFDADLGTLISAVRQIAAGGQSAQGELQAAEVRLGADGRSIDALCTAAPVH